MLVCQSCESTLSATDTECDYCGEPVAGARGEPKRKTVLGGDNLYTPERKAEQRKRRTRIEGAGGGGDAFAEAGKAAFGGSAPPHYDPKDPFMAAVVETDDEEQPGAETAEQQAPSIDGSRHAEPNRRLAGVLITYSNSANGAVYPIYKGRNVIGRVGEDVQVGLDDGRVSSRHCTIISRESGTYLTDGAGQDMSLNGTFHARSDGELEDIAVERVALVDGDLIKVGHTLFLLRIIDRELAAKLWPGE